MNLDQKEMKRFNPVSSDIILHFSVLNLCYCLHVRHSYNFCLSLQVDAFPGDIIIFGRVLNLLRGLLSPLWCQSYVWLFPHNLFCLFDIDSGLSSTMDLHIVYMDIMRPFAESALSG